MKTIIKFMLGVLFSLVVCLGCSKDSDISCGTITEVSISFSMISGSIFNHLTVKLPNGSIRYDSVGVESFNSDRYKVGDEYCEATRTTP